MTIDVTVPLVITIKRLFVIKHDIVRVQVKTQNGEAGRRSQCLSHAKRALYHLSYIPTSLLTRLRILLIVNSIFAAE